MSGGNVAYHLRPNKYVERSLFMELLGKVYQGRPMDQIVYVSLGGPQLEDLRQAHYQLGMTHLVSLEEDPIVYGRQQFNLRPYIACRNESTGEFLQELDTASMNKALVIWLDYATAKQRRPQLSEYEAYLSKLQPGDTIKITLNANPSTLGEGCMGELPDKVMERRLDELREQISDYLEEPITSKEMTARGLVQILAKAIKNAALKAVQDTPRRRLIPISAFSYQDGPHQMLTLTVHVCTASDADNIKEELHKLGWNYLPSDWDDVTRINIPDLTAKERLYIEGLLYTSTYTDVDHLHEALPFQFDSKLEASKGILLQYIEHYRRYPSYLQVIL